jgi:hypothetical protein
VFTSPLKEMSLLFWMIFAQHKRLIELLSLPSSRATFVMVSPMICIYPA